MRIAEASQEISAEDRRLAQLRRSMLGLEQLRLQRPADRVPDAHDKLALETPEIKRMLTALFQRLTAES